MCGIDFLGPIVVSFRAVGVRWEKAAESSGREVWVDLRRWIVGGQEPRVGQ